MDEWGRPLGVSVLAISALFFGILGLLGGGLVFSGSSTASMYGYGVVTGIAAMIGGILIVMFGLFAIVTGWGMWSGKRWAWTLGIGFGGLIVALTAYSISVGQWFDVIGLVIELYILWYFWRPHVKEYFGKRGQASPS